MPENQLTSSISGVTWQQLLKWRTACHNMLLCEKGKLWAAPLPIWQNQARASCVARMAPAALETDAQLSKQQSWGYLQCDERSAVVYSPKALPSICMTHLTRRSDVRVQRQPYAWCLPMVPPLQTSSVGEVYMIAPGSMRQQRTMCWGK